MDGELRKWWSCWSGNESRRRRRQKTETEEEKKNYGNKINNKIAREIMRKNGRTNWGREEDGIEERNITVVTCFDLALGSTHPLTEMSTRNLPGP
jgi:hypothetical protein